MRQECSRDGACQTTCRLARPDEGAQVGGAIDRVLARLDDQNRVGHHITECNRHCRQKSANGGKSNRLVCKDGQKDHGNDLSQSSKDQVALSSVAKEGHVIADEAEEDLAAPRDVNRRNQCLQATRLKQEYALEQVLNRQVEQNARTLVEVLKSCLVQESAIEALEEASVSIPIKILVHRLATLLRHPRLANVCLRVAQALAIGEGKRAVALEVVIRSVIIDQKISFHLVRLETASLSLCPEQLAVLVHTVHRVLQSNLELGLAKPFTCCELLTLRLLKVSF